MTLQIAAWNVALVLGFMTALWVVSVRKRNASIVDPCWSICFLIVTVHSAAKSGVTPAKTLLLVMVVLWSVRLCLHLLIRGWGQPEDPRYAKFRRRFGRERYWWFSFFQVFLLQGSLALLISAPLQLVAVAKPPDGVSVADWIGLSVFTIGFFFEVVADRQLQVFRRNPQNEGKVLASGLWRLSRHPNYFGEAVLWWGLWLCAVDEPWGWMAVLSPVLMTFLLLRVSGVAMLEPQLAATKPGYAAYVATTSTFVPRKPHRPDSGG